jgi:DNA repair protein RadC
MTSTKPHFSGHRSRLRQRLLDVGSEAIADYELLEMLLYAASARSDTKPLAKALIAHFGSFAEVVSAPSERLKEVEGVGEATIASIKVVEAAAQRLIRHQAAQMPVLNSWQKLLDYCRLKMGALAIEEFRVLFLNHKNMLIADEAQHQGTVNHTTAYPREVVKRALELGASAIIIAHNHPSGDPTPSQADIDMTEAIHKAAKTMGIQLHDHLIIAKDKHFSFKSHEFL